jgi:nucleotide-binding universal stress UspA family protein
MSESTITNRTIVVGVDGSEVSLRALEWAVHEARRRSAGIEIRVCYSVPYYGEPGMFGAYAVESQVEAIKQEHEQLAAGARDHALRLDPDLSVSAVVVFAPAVANLAEVDPGTLVVVGSSGRSGIAGVLGSVTTGILHRAKGPLVVVPPASSTAAPLGVSMKKIVVGIDGSPTSEEALRWAMEEAKLAGAELVVLHGWHYPYPGGPRDEMRVDALAQLEASIEAVGPRTEGDVSVHAKLIEGQAAEALIHESADADLLVVGSRGRGGFKAMLLGSTSRAVVQHASCPVAVIRHRTD